MTQPDLLNIPPHVEMTGARLVALDLLHAVLDRRQPFDQVLDENAEFAALTGRDRAFVRMLTATTLRRLGQIDDFIRRATERDEAPSPPLLHNVLRMGAAQLAFMAVPDHAAVDTSVRIAEERGLSRQKGLVNAVLRRVATSHREWIAKQDEARLNVPEWLMKHWSADYGLRSAAEIAVASLAEAPLDIALKNQSESAHWAEALEATVLPSGTLRRAAGGAVRDLPGFDDGMWWIQDASAALPARLFGNIEGRAVVDLCAAPGGKTAQLAALGAHVVALDRSAQRLKRLEENVRRLRLEKNVSVTVADATAWQPKDKVDFILLDAPCTATGTARRNPDVLHLKSQNDMDRLADTQRRLLDNAANMLASGGLLLYCTCSLQKAEGEAQVEALLTRAPVKRLPIAAAELGGIEGLVTPAGDVRVLPYHLAALGGMDGFYISRLQKI